MSDDNIARRHRQRAAELRAMADDETVRRVRSQLLELAADYDCLALLADGLDPTPQALETTQSHLTVGAVLPFGRIG